MGEAGRLTGDDTDPRAAVAPARHLLDAAVIEGGRRRALVLGIHLGELAAGTQRRRQHSLEDVLIDHLGHATGEARWRPAGVSVDGVAVATGLRGEAKLTVGEADTARALGTGTVEVLGTPRIVALCEEASCRAVASSLAPGTTTVDMKVRIDHLQPSPIGATVVAEALLQKIEGRRLMFTVSASDDRGLVAVGQLVRVVVDVEHFLGKCGA